MHGERERRAPLAGAGLGGEPGDALRLVVERLRHRGVRLVRAGRRHRLVLEVDAGRRARAPPRAARPARAASAATAGGCRAPHRGCRSTAPATSPARSAPSGTAAPGRRGRPAPGWPGCSGGSSGSRAGAATLNQAVGILSAGRWKSHRHASLSSQEPDRRGLDRPKSRVLAHEHRVVAGLGEQRASSLAADPGLGDPHDAGGDRARPCARRERGRPRR